MFRKALIPLFLMVVGLVLAAGSAGAQGPVPRHSDSYWQGTYWTNPTLSGEAIMSRADAEINFDWGTGSPSEVVPVDDFSARWRKYISVSGGNYRFTATADDGIRVYVDGRLIIDQWYEHPARTFTADTALAAGHHEVVVEYYEHGGLAVARVSWEPLTVFHAWRGEYYANQHLNGDPVVVRDDARLDFAWGLNPPAEGLPADNFSVRWTRTLDLQPGRYGFTTWSDDGVRLWVNGHLLIDQWHNQAASDYHGQIWVGGQAQVKLEYYDARDYALVNLRWYPAGAPPTPQPGTGIVVDDADPGFVTGGSAGGWHTANEGHDGRLHWTRNNNMVRYNYNWARWYPELAAGQYEVFVYVPDRYTTTANARYWISHSNGFTVRTVDQSARGGEWVSLGTYRFRGNDQDYVSLADVTFEPYLSRLIAFDAVMWQAR